MTSEYLLGFYMQSIKKVEFITIDNAVTFPILVSPLKAVALSSICKLMFKFQVCGHTGLGGRMQVILVLELISLVP